ncbi:MAG: leucine-rich repeat domain-containing protein, partial [Shimia sp.]
MSDRSIDEPQRTHRPTGHGVSALASEVLSQVVARVTEALPASLEHLEIRDMNLTALPKLSHLTQLKSLKLSRCHN